MKSKTYRKRRLARRSKKHRRFLTRRRRVYRGGFNLPVPEGSIVGVDLDPKDPYSVPVLLRKNLYETEVLEE